MITSDEQLRQAVGQLERMYRALATLRTEVSPKNARQFALLAEGPLDEIRHLQAQIDAYAGVVAAEEQDADIWLRIHGRNIEWLDVPTSALVAVLDAFRKGVQTVAGFLLTGRAVKRLNMKVKQACDLRLVAFRPGSLSIGMRLPDEPSFALDSSREHSLARQALVEYLTMASWLSAEDVQRDFAQRIGDIEKRQPLLNALKPLVTSLRGEVEYIEVSSRLFSNGKPIRLTPHVHHRLTIAIRQSAKEVSQAVTEEVAVMEQIETDTGHLREIDLDNRSFTLRRVDRGQEVHCTFEEHLLEIARTALDRRVRVTGSYRARKGYGPRVTFHVSRLEVLDDPLGKADRGHSV
jgi:hypothetical protein